MKPLKNNPIPVLISLLSILICASIFLTYRNNQVIEEHKALQKQTEQIKQKSQAIVNYIMHGLDLGVRGFAHTKQEVLLSPFNEAISMKSPIFQDLKILLQAQQLDLQNLHMLENGMDEYIQHCKYMVEVARKDSMDQFRQLLQEDRGTALWEKCMAFKEPVFAHIDQLNQQTEARYETAIISNRWVQALLFVIGLPTLGFVLYQIRLDKKNRLALLKQLEENNRKYIFNPGENLYEGAVNPQEIVDTSIKNFQNASEFIHHISEGNYNIEWQGFNETNQEWNQANLAGKLIKMREQLKQGKKEEERRLWVNEGLTTFSEITRSRQDNIENFAQEAILFFTKYLHAQQGSLFVLKDTDEQKPYLELASCYAFNRKKFVKKQVEPGQGLVGQTFLEGQTMLLTAIPQGYTSITSGLGDATPACLIIVPIKQNDKVEGVLELASFKRFEEHEISFLERCSESVASALINAKTTEKMGILITELQMQSEQMRAQEEEMRQNMEELQATQEHQNRLQQELKGEYAAKTEK